MSSSSNMIASWDEPPPFNRSNGDHESEDFDDGHSQKSDDGPPAGTIADTDNSRNSKRDLASEETKYVLWSRITFLLVLLLSTAGAAFAVWKVSHDDDAARFETRYHDFARQILEVSQINALAVFTVFESISQQITANVQNNKDVEWPLITIPQFEAQAQLAFKATGARNMGFTPLINETNKVQYETYRQLNQSWIQEGFEYIGSDETSCQTNPKIWFSVDEGKTLVYPENQGLYAPASQISPIYYCSFVNYDLMGESSFRRGFDTVKTYNRAALSEIRNLGVEIETTNDWPTSFMTAPIYNKVGGANREIVAVLTGEVPWDSYFKNLLPEGIDDITLVVENTCNQTVTYRINGPDVEYIGVGDDHDAEFNYLEESAKFTAFATPDECQFTLKLYPSDAFREAYRTNDPIVNTCVVVAIFVFTAVFFVIFNQLVERRQSKVMDSATRTHAIVSSLFPENVHDRLMDNGGNGFEKTGRSRLDSFRDDAMAPTTHNTIEGGAKSRPIADFFPNATILFADLAGFTAWSSTRDPVQVFQLLETLYSAFDKIANQLNIFKVETIGDCYVAVCGLPTARDDHAVAMFRFSRQCMAKMNELVHELAVSLGPGTSDLSMRCGLHSGPVTAGVLRGQKSRFQLFGDTVNTAARIESTGLPNCIHLSQQTAEQLRHFNKGHWCRPREDSVVAKGKGELKTYWGVYRSAPSTSSRISSNLKPAASSLGDDNDSGSDRQPQTTDAEDQLVEWNVDNLLMALKKIAATRGTTMAGVVDEDASTKADLRCAQPRAGSIAIDEVVDTLEFSNSSTTVKKDPDTIALDPKVVEEVRDYVQTIAKMYRNSNHFHNFAHASHVVQSVRKLFSRIVAIPVDPMVEFASIFAALVHDVDHLGVPNSTLIATQPELSKMYQNRSVAEQNSLDLAWNLLFESKYDAFRACIYSNEAELRWFRSLAVNAVIATDIMDSDLKHNRDRRWAIAYPPSPTVTAAATTPANNGNDAPSSNAHTDLQLTVVLEHLLQASDVAHTMQHWHVYAKWNERLFAEQHAAYKNGRSEVHPVDNWYKGELAFFDFYILPLARKLKECGVFGVSSDEYLQYATMNREEWSRKGESMVESYVANLE